MCCRSMRGGAPSTFHAIESPSVDRSYTGGWCCGWGSCMLEVEACLLPFCASTVAAQATTASASVLMLPFHPRRYRPCVLRGANVSTTRAIVSVRPVPTASTFSPLGEFNRTSLPTTVQGHSRCALMRGGGAFRVSRDRKSQR